MTTAFRRRFRVVTIGVLVAWLGCIASGHAAEAVPPLPLPPAEAFFSGEELGAVALSPSGRWLAIGAQPSGQRRGIAVYDLHGQEPPRAVAGFDDIDIGDFHWVGDERLVFELVDQMRGSGDQRYGRGLFSVRRDGSELNQHILMRWWSRPGQGTQASRRLDATHRLMAVPRDQPPGAEVVIVGGSRNHASLSADWVLKRLNIVSGRVESLNVAAPAHVRRWHFNNRGDPVLAVTRHAGEVAVQQREVDAQGLLTRDWRTLWRAEAMSAPWSLHGLDRAGRLYVTEPSGPGGERVLKRFDPVLGAPEPQALIAVPGFDFTGRLLEDDGDDPLLGVRALADAETTLWLNPTLAALQKAIDARLPERVNRLICRRCRHADRTVVVTSYADRHPGEIWLWRGDGDTPRVWRRIGVKRPAIDPRRMAMLAFTRFAARDGLGIPLWVTQPALPAKPGPAPAVVLVHGGPWVRGGDWEWQALPQFLASRGYVVLEPEFRGSAGYGAKHFRAGWKQWGRAMQDDLADAVAWAARRGLVDPTRVCIAGASYGGYAALMGLVRQPEVFRCGVAWVPVTEPRWLLREGSPDDRSDEVRSYTLPQLLADPATDGELLEQISPLAQVARIQAPLLLAWSEEDRRVPPEHAQRLHEALRRAGHKHEAVGYAGEGHSWLKTSTWLDFARRLEDFLARELQPPPAPERR